jgi:hypothetical protein
MKTKQLVKALDKMCGKIEALQQKIDTGRNHDCAYLVGKAKSIMIRALYQAEKDQSDEKKYPV